MERWRKDSETEIVSLGGDCNQGYTLNADNQPLTESQPFLRIKLAD